MDRIDVAIIGAGAAGLATAIFLGRHRPATRVVVFDGARRPGAKILVSGGARCNVTNVAVTATDFHGGSPAAIRRVLRALPVPETVQFFRDLGVALHEETGGKLFPDSGRARDVLEALLGGLAATGATLRAGCRVTGLRRVDDGFEIATAAGPVRAPFVVLATGGLSLPKTGSDGAGYRFARDLGHTVVPTTPALVPLVLDDGTGLHRELAGVAHPVRLRLRASGRGTVVVDGPLLWTHVGVSGPAVLDVSRHWLRASLEGRGPGLSASLAPGETFEGLEAGWTSRAAAEGRTLARTLLTDQVPASVAAALVARAGLEPDTTLAALTRVSRRALIHGLTDLPLPVTGSRGYRFAEVTAGGLALSEFDPATLASRRCPGLVAVGEVLDVDGRLGGFNFQWAWASAAAAAAGLARALAARAP